MNQTTFNNLTITSQPIGVGKRLSRDGYKHDYYMLYPKYIISINDKDFDYSGSANDLATVFKSKSVFYSCKQTLTIAGEKQIVDQIWVNVGRNTRDLYDRHKPMYANSINSYQQLINNFMQHKQSHLTHEQMLFAFRCIIEDALVAHEFCTPGQFGKEFDYTDIDECIRIYTACKDTCIKLGMSEHQLRSILDQLSEQGIE